jgi:ADP-heptose:LPS heptosyltransferase
VHNIKHILVIRLSAMGDVAITVPVLKTMLLQHPEIKITIASRTFFQPFFENIPNLYFFPVDVDDRHKGFFGLFRLFFDLKKLKIDAVADLHNVIRSKAIRKTFALFGKKVAASNKERADKNALIRLEGKVFKPVKSMIDIHCDTFNKLGFYVNLYTQKPETIFPPKVNLSSEIIEITGKKEQKWIGIAPFAQYESKVYPQDLMQIVIDELASHSENKILLFGGGDHEIVILNQMKRDYENVIVIAGKITFKQELELIAHLDIMLSMDSGNAHIAAMLGVNVVTLWGATHPYAGFLPFNQNKSSAIVSDRNKYPLLPTSVYGNKQVDGYEDAMRTILPSTVIAKMHKELDKLTKKIKVVL